jgi:hypothetical protein
MRQCIALAGLACLMAAGCAHSGMMGGARGRQANHVITSQRALRPNISRDFRPSAGFDVKPAAYVEACGGTCDQSADCGACDECPECGCPVDCGCNPQCNTCCSRCRCMIEGVASGFCGGCGPGGGMCPHGMGYPEYPSFNPGPPVAQVAYPYYTVRGPRDFLRNNPPTIGPY